MMGGQHSQEQHMLNGCFTPRSQTINLTYVELGHPFVHGVEAHPKPSKTDLVSYHTASLTAAPVL